MGADRRIGEPHMGDGMGVLGVGRIGDRLAGDQRREVPQRLLGEPKRGPADCDRQHRDRGASLYPVVGVEMATRAGAHDHSRQRHEAVLGDRETVDPHGARSGAALLLTCQSS